LFPYSFFSYNNLQCLERFYEHAQGKELKEASMCFSMEASFAAAGVLTGAGVLACRSTTKKRLKYLALTPFIFAAQQVAEGLLWFVSSRGGPLLLGEIAQYIFLFFAYVVWPLWIPWSFFEAEPKAGPRNMLRILLAWGLLVSILGVLLLIFVPVLWGAHGHISYLFMGSIPLGMYGPLALYAIPTLAPFFVSSLALSRLLGVLSIISLLLTLWFWQSYFTSVWCFFAAVLSAFIVVILKKN
jgi:hypothetical protein